MPAFPYTALIPGNIAWFRDESDWIARTGVGAPHDPARPYQPWRDNAFQWGSWWTTLGDDSVTYRVLASGLTPIDSPEFLATYANINSAVVAAFRQFAFLFPNGVPYLRDLTIPKSWAKSLNFAVSPPGVSQSAIPYPLDAGRLSNLMLLPPGPDGIVMAQDYQEFGRQNSPALTDYAAMLAVVDGIRKSGMSPKDQIYAIRVAVTQGQPPIPAI